MATVGVGTAELAAETPQSLGEKSHKAHTRARNMDRRIDIRKYPGGRILDMARRKNTRTRRTDGYVFLGSHHTVVGSYILGRGAILRFLTRNL
jgi:hypothetical protein